MNQLKKTITLKNTTQNIFEVTIQRDHINMAVYFRYPVCSMYACTVAYTVQITFSNLLEKYGHVYLVRM